MLQSQNASNSSPLATAQNSPDQSDLPYYVKALLWPGDVRWNRNSGPAGTPVQLTYSFMSSVPSVYQVGQNQTWNDNGLTLSNFRPLSTAQQEAVRQGLTLFRDISDLDFVEDPTGNGTLKFGTANPNNNGVSGWAYPPASEFGQRQGHIWLNHQSVGMSNPIAGTDAFLTILQQVAQALGLKAAVTQSPNPTLPPGTAESSLQYTIMTDSPHPAYGDRAAAPASLMLYDIAAIQYLYGARVSTRADDNLYQWPTNATFLETIWDGSGIDTISAANQSTNTRINLNAGEFSSIGSNVGGAEDNVSIAFGTTIEHGIGGSGNDELIGNSADNDLEGRAGNDLLWGREGNDTLDGGTGIDEMQGGQGSDTYLVDSADQVVEQPESGRDRVITSVSYTLAAHVEDVTLVGNSSLNATGNELANQMQGNEVSNTLMGAAGNDQLEGRNGDDLLDGGVGQDRMIGGQGNDTYQVDQSTDEVVEAMGEGRDRVLAASSYTLGSQVEDLTLLGDAATSGTGNELANQMQGNEARNTLIGQSGDDQLDGQDGNDLLDGGTGTDTMAGGSGNDTYRVERTQDQVVETAEEGQDRVLASISYTLSDHVEHLNLLGDTSLNGTGNDLANEIQGNSASNTLAGQAGDDQLTSGSGDDVLDGGTGVDRMTGGEGNDTYRVNHTLDVVVESSEEGRDRVIATVSYTLVDHAEDLTLGGRANLDGIGNEQANAIQGNDAENLLSGEAGQDTLSGQGGDDVLDGGRGTDEMAGGEGNDTYRVDRATDKTVERAGEGRDLIIATTSYILIDHIEDLTLAGNATIHGTGNDLANLIQGNSASNTLAGEAGDDQLDGGDGDDLLDGGLGLDELVGGTGNDLYRVDRPLDEVVENQGEGRDRVIATRDYGLADHVEDLTLDGDTAIQGTGNDLANLIQGNEASNTLAGRAGDDELHGGEGEDDLDGGTGIDEMVGGEGDDTYRVNHLLDRVVESPEEGRDRVITAISYTLGDHTEVLLLRGQANVDGTGNGLANVIQGNAGENVISGQSGNDELHGHAGDDDLDGGTGMDEMIGGEGNDTYRVDRAADRVIELNDEGRDGIIATTSYVLVEHIEDLTLAGNATIHGTGNDLANVIQGNEAGNTLAGEAGNDQLRGGAGNDVLEGGSGVDTLAGGNDNDTYRVDRADVVLELVGGGTDTVISTGNYRLSVHVERLVFTGNSPSRGVGNTLNNTILGNSRRNVLLGGAGSDILRGNGGRDRLAGDAGNDVVNGGDGLDRLFGGTGTDTLSGGAGVDQLVGGAGADALFGGSQPDRLFGGTGDDALFGGEGRDYLVGGVGADRFIIASSRNQSDIIADFVSEEGDRLLISTGALGFRLKRGLLAEELFVEGRSATEADDRFIYDASSRRLFFDADGTGPAVQIPLVSFAKPVILSSTQIVITA